MSTNKATETSVLRQQRDELQNRLDLTIKSLETATKNHKKLLADFKRQQELIMDLNDEVEELYDRLSNHEN